MATQNNSTFKEGQSTTRSLFFMEMTTIIRKLRWNLLASTRLLNMRNCL